MAMHIDHISICTPNLYYGAHRLRLESGLGFYDGGFFAGGHANRIFPLGGQAYLEIGGIVESAKVRDPAKQPWWYRKVQILGECFNGLCMRVDTMEELQEIAEKKKFTISKDPVTRTRPNGTFVRAFTAPSPATTWTVGLPNWYYHLDFPHHPSGQPTFTWPNCSLADGIKFIEVGGTPEAMTEWLGVDQKNFPFRYNGKPPGVYAIGVKTLNSHKEAGSVVIRRPSATEL
jgi:hypothetical protein